MQTQKRSAQLVDSNVVNTLFFFLTENDIVLWRDPTISFIFVALIHLYYFLFQQVPFISLISLFVILLALVPPALTYLDEKFKFRLELKNSEVPVLTQENMSEFFDAVINILNTMLEMLSSIILCKNMDDNKKLAFIALITFFIGIKFNTVTLLFIFSNMFLFLPVIYKRYKREMDDVVHRIYIKATDTFKDIERKTLKKYQ